MRFRAGFVGTGYIAEYHLAAVRRLKNVELVGVVDADADKAAAFAAGANCTAYSDIESLRTAGVDVIHVLTPPHTHAALAQRALRAGCHVLVEKPLAVDVADCYAILRTARDAGRQVCVNHSLEFDPRVRHALETVRSGKLGKIISVDILRSSVYPPYRGGPLPPQYRSPGYPFRDLGVHALYLFQAFLGPLENVAAEWRSLGGDPNLAYDEWRAIVRCRDGLGQFQLSWNIRPLQSQIIVQGTRGVLRADLFLMSQSVRAALPVPKAAERIVNAFTDSVPMLVDMPLTVVRFLTKRALPYHGLQDLVRAFYQAVEGGAPMPVTVEEAIPVVKWVEEIACQADKEHAAKLEILEMARRHPDAVSRPRPVLVTGASGNLGGAIARALAARGERVRILVRRIPERVPDLTEVVVGDLGDPDAVDKAVLGASKVIHAGAATKGGWPEHECGTIVGTRNVLGACRKYDIAKLVYISTMSVLDMASTPAEIPLDEGSALEPHPEKRGAYTHAKSIAENLVCEAARTGGLRAVILRPGKIYGGASPLLSPAIAMKFGKRWLVLGDGKVRIPFVHLDDVVDAVLAAIASPLEDGQVIQILGGDQPTQNEVLMMCEGPQAKIIHLPRPVIFTLSALSEIAFKLLKRDSPVSVYRMKSGLARRRFASRNAGPLLGWQPLVSVEEYVRGKTKCAAGHPDVAPGAEHSLRRAAEVQVASRQEGPNFSCPKEH